MSSRNGSHKGPLVAAVLAGSWRSSNYPPLTIDEVALQEITPLLCRSGAAALAWRRIKDTSLASSPAGETLRDTYRHQSLRSGIHEQQVEKVFRLLREAGVDAFVVKGWAAAILYEQQDLRPAGDIDVCVHPEHYDKALAVLADSECAIDLHTVLAEIGERSFDDLFARSTTVPLGAETVRTLCTEDHLALLCIHLLKHGGWRPLWLCDIAAAVESLPSNFNWDICLGTHEQRARWIACTFGLAERLLQADVSRVPLTRDQMRVPEWITETVLYHWSRLFPGDALPMQAAPLMSVTLRRRQGILKGIWERWPDPITATFNLQGSVNDFPRFPYQLADFLRIGVRFVFASSGKNEANSDIA
jgi:hypothetical protein